MARSIKNLNKYDDTDPYGFPSGRIKDNTGSNDGTEVSEKSYGDIHQFFAYLMRNANFQYSGMPDSVRNGFQLVDAIKMLANKNDLIKEARLVADDVSKIYLDADISRLEIDETIIFRASFDSNNNINVATCSKRAWSKPIEVKGVFKQGQKIRLINKSTIIEISGIYESTEIADIKTQLETIQTNQTKIDKVMAVFQQNGAMVFWNKPANEIPQGWAEVVDWRGRFPVGLDISDNDFSVMGKQAGEKAVTLSLNQIPSHNHGLKFGKERVGTGNQNGLSAQGGNSFSSNSESAGGGQSHNNLPPYRVVLFIEYIGN